MSGRRVRPVRPVAALLDHLAGEGLGLRLGQSLEAVLGDDGDDGEDPAVDVGAAGRGVVVGRVPQRLERGEGRLAAVESLAEQFLQGTSGVRRSGALGVEAGLLVESAGDVEAEDAAAFALGRGGVVADEEGTTARPCMA